MCTRADCERHIGQWVQFHTQWGLHRGIIERVTNRSAILVSPRRYIPAQFASETRDISDETMSADMKKLDLALTWYGSGAAGGGYGGYGGIGWGRWAVSFLAIYALFGLWW
ncbi:hypothetical protein LLE49_01325 [Alicyclobacillus tolerans]|uniref:hypothetical protein n=1 Tax=Alicyclobacillus tolerans TaxID=90970 RepID=UPI001F370DCC|nr:hypothetical protein [Alicyclobacillus tolerans]MCF8563385.1 hypothetical protein [Alicyclobacillus tolerans]